MISQHSQTAKLTVEVSQEQSREVMLLDAIARSTLYEAIAKLQDFIALRPDAREVRRKRWQ
jgi:hypothetical protein